MSYEQSNSGKSAGGTGGANGSSFTERVELAGDQVVIFLSQLFKDGNIRRIVLRSEKGQELFAIPLLPAAAVGGIAIVAAPTLAAAGAAVALLKKVQVDIERTDVQPKPQTQPESASGAGASGTGQTGDEPRWWEYNSRQQQ